MGADLKSLRIDRTRKASHEAKWSMRWIVVGIILVVLASAGALAWRRLDQAVEVDVIRVRTSAVGAASGPGIILQATGYVVAAHKIQVASKVMGRVAWIGVEKGDRVQEGQVIVRLEDDEYRAQLQQARGQLASLQARLSELVNGSRPEEIARAEAELRQAEAELKNARVTLERTRSLVSEGVLSRQALDDAQGRHDSVAARVAAMDKALALVRLGPRSEQIESLLGQVEQARGAVSYYETQLANTVIRAPVTGTILERVVEKGEFVTTSFVGERGAKGYVVSMADLRHLQVELDVNQNDFAKLGSRQPGVVTTDAYPDRKYDGFIEEISPEANRQKATVQVKVRIANPDSYLRPEMNATVSFHGDGKAAPGGASAKPQVWIPQSAVRDNAVFVVLDGHAVRRPVRTGATGPSGVRVDEGLIGGEDLIVNPPAGLNNQDKVRPISRPPKS